MTIPFIKWAGGKRKLVPTIIDVFPEDFNPSEHKFFEPMVGGGALMLALGEPGSLSGAINRELLSDVGVVDSESFESGSHQKSDNSSNISKGKQRKPVKGNLHVPGKKLVINDVNPDLIATYNAIKKFPEELILLLAEMEKHTTKADFENVKATPGTNQLEIAARFIYLNKTCFNGLWRVNGSGNFNVPWGQRETVKIFEAKNIREVSQRLKGAQIRNTTYIAAIEDAKAGDLVYLDPPYIPLSASSSFSKYQKDNFGLLDHVALSGVIHELTNRGVRSILSNSDTLESRRIFGSHLYLYGIQARRSVGAASKTRTMVQEIMAFNYKPVLSEDTNLVLISEPSL
jgi:DNA adenine methylase